MGEIKPVVMAKYEFDFGDLSILKAISLSLTIKIPTEGIKPIFLKSNSSP